jgi:hypothetical protein
MEPIRNTIPPAPEPYSPSRRLRAVIPDARNENTNVAVGALWMLGITLALFFLPTLNGLIGGFVGGYKVGTLRRALAAAILPGVAAAVGLWVIFAILGSPIFGVLAGSALLLMIALSEIGLFVGAALGGYSAERPRSTD